jgi:hypothetical protein
MEIFERVKAILFNPKEEWTVIEAENEPHINVLTKYLLILALIPTLAFFAGEYLENRSGYNDYVETETAKIEEPYRNYTYGGSPEIIAEQRTEIAKKIAEFEKTAEEQFHIINPFGTTKWNIIFAACLFGIIVGGAYISATIINALSNRFGSEKDFNRTFSLVAYSLTPLCIAGILYAFHSFASFVPYIGFYGLYLLYLGIEPQLKPAVDKKSTCLVISAIAIVGVWLVLAKIAVPEIQKNMMTEECISIAKETDNSGLPIDVKNMRKVYEKQMKSELENHKY